MSFQTDADSDPVPSSAAGDTRRYVIGDCVGTGGLGSVHRAWDAHLGRWVAIKRLATGADSGDPATADARLRREANALAALQHPHIVTVHDVGVDAEGPFVVMEFVEGETLEAVATRAPLDLESFGTLVVQTLGAVEAAHRAGLLHRDLKPGNIMLTPLPDDGFTVKVLDFGLAKFAPRPDKQTLDQGDSLLGSIYFMAPEQFRREPLDARVDLYALGAIFYYSLTSHHPFDGDTTAQVMASHLEGRLLRPLARLRPDVPPALAAWVERLMSRVPTARPASAAAALAQARPFLAGVHIPGGPRRRTGTVPVFVGLDGAGAAPAAGGTRRRWLWPAVGVGVLLLGAGGFLATQGTWPPFHPAPTPTPAASAAPSPSAAPNAARVATTTPPPIPAGAAAAASPRATAAPGPVPSPVQATTSPAAPPAAPTTPAPPPPAVPGEVTLEAADVAALRTHLGQTLTVTGTPVGVGQSRAGTVFYLNFGSRPHEGLSVVCFGSGGGGGGGSTVSQETFRAFVGRPVRVRGKLGDFKGDLQLVIDSPASIRPAS